SPHTTTSAQRTPLGRQPREDAMKRFGLLGVTLAVALASFAVLGCGDNKPKDKDNTPKDNTAPSGEVKLDGSSTVYPVALAAADEFQKANKGIKVTVGVSGTGGGFKKFVVGHTDISDASRPILKAEIESCKSNKIEFMELPIAYDAITVVVSVKNDW